MLIETQLIHLLRSLTGWSGAQTALSLLGKGDMEGDPCLQPGPGSGLGPGGCRAASRRLAAGAPGVLTARELHRGIDFRETSSDHWAFSSSTMASVAGLSLHHRRGWPVPAHTLPGGCRNGQGTHPPDLRRGEREGLWSCSGKEIGQAWAVKQMERPSQFPSPHWLVSLSGIQT